MIRDIWTGFRLLPLWVQLWLAIVLVPANLAALWFINAPQGMLIAVLAVGGMTPNLFILLKMRRFGPEMAIAHLVLWPPLLIAILWLQTKPLPTDFAIYLWVLFAVDLISVAFDIRDARAMYGRRNRTK